MKNLKNKMRGVQWLILLILFVMAGMALAETINLRIDVPGGTIKNEQALTLASGTIQVMKGGTSLLSGNITNGGYFYQTSNFSASNGDSLYLRAAWSANQKNYYRKSDPYSISWQQGAPPSPLYNWLATNFSNYYIEEAPPKASIGTISISYTGELKPLATIPINVDTTHHEVSTRHIKIWEHPSGTVKVDTDCSASYTAPAGVLQLNTVYSVEAYAKNQFGTGATSDIKGFEVKGPTTGKASNLKIKLENLAGDITLSWQHQNADGFVVYQSADDGKTWTDITASLTTTGTDTKNATIANPPAKAYYKVKANGGSFAEEIVGKITFNLNKLDGSTGLNSIAIPFDTNSDAVVVSSKMPMHAQGIATNIGTKFESIGRWKEEAQSTEGFVKTPDGFIGANFTIEKNVGYQISVSEDLNWTVVGQVSGKT